MKAPEAARRLWQDGQDDVAAMIYRTLALSTKSKVVRGLALFLFEKCKAGEEFPYMDKKGGKKF